MITYTSHVLLPLDMHFLIGANEIQWANMITLEKDYKFFSPKKAFSYEWILEQCFLQVVIINAYSFPNTWYIYIYIIFLNKYEFLKVSWFFYKFSVMFKSDNNFRS
jgi:hypothetical protein